MCGIAGELSTGSSAEPVDAARLTRMREALLHRGPDGAGLWISADRSVGLAHRRLAIVDLSERASQPMRSRDGRLVLCFNGQIYNHRALRAELERAGHRHWQSDHSDTEVILQAFEHWGIECLSRLRGIFALALWDARERALWLVRDRIGVKPLYWARRRSGVVFASEIKALLADPRQERAVNAAAFVDFLSFLATPAPDTMFAGIHKLEPGSWLRFGADGRVHGQRWWDVWDHVTPWRGASLEAAAASARDRLRECVQMQAAADVPVGVFLSGGIDSSSNTALLAESTEQPVHAFSIAYDRDYPSTPSELPFAREVAAWTGARLHERRISRDDLLTFLPRLVELQDEPIADPVCVPMYYLAELARKSGVSVCQVGEGADELFWGYPEWQSIARLERLGRWLPPLAARAAAALLRHTGRGARRSTALLERAACAHPLFWGGAEGFVDRRKQRLLGPEARRAAAGRRAWDVLAPIRRRFEEAAWDPSPPQWMTYLDLRLRLPELLLMRVDKMTMAVSLEGRVPFLDHELVAWVLGLPPALRSAGAELKPILKRAMVGIVPDRVRLRPKQGFAVPIHEWFLGRLGEHALREVQQFAQHSGLLDVAELRAVWAQGRAWERWILLNAALWWRQCIAR